MFLLQKVISSFSVYVNKRKKIVTNTKFPIKNKNKETKWYYINFQL